MEVVFWICIAIIFYTYIGYGIVLWFIIKLKRLIKPSNPNIYSREEMPETTLIVACYNEEDIIREKIEDTLKLSYPEGKLNLYFVTDGSNDDSMDIIREYPQITLFHSEARRGKNAAVHRVMEQVTSPIVIFCDANTFLNEKALENIVRHYKDPKVGAVAGEKRVMQGEADAAAGSGEGAYWKYESQLKKWDSELYTVVGAAGELFSVRTDLYEEVPPNTIIEDFQLSMSIVEKGYKTVYEPESFASETSSESIKEEEKRKIRIAAGGIQSVVRLRGLLNFFKYGVVTFQYVSHRVLRWTLTPLCLLIAFVLNAILATSGNWIYIALFAGQILFYGLAILGGILQSRKIKVKALFIPYYFVFMNWAVYLGFFRYLKGNQSAVWEKAKRAKLES